MKVHERLEIGDEVCFWESEDVATGFIVEMDDVAKGFVAVKWKGVTAISVHSESSLIALNKPHFFR